MANVTFSLPDETVRRLRKAARADGKGRKGAIPERVDAAVREHPAAAEAGAEREEFRALRGGKGAARATSLRELASELERLGVGPRDALIESSAPLPSMVRTGPRGHLG